MRFMLLNGHGIRMNIDGAKLHVRDGRFSTKERPMSYVFAPKKIDVDSIAIYGQSGTISIPAIRWLVKQGIQVSVLNWDGKLLTTMLPPESVQVRIKFDQYRAYENMATRIKIARKLIEAKFERSRLVLDYLEQRYPDVGNDLERDACKLSGTNTIKEIMGVEGAVAQLYWSEFQKIIPDKYEFDGRNIGKTGRPMGAVDQVNCMLNYGYSLLEAECLRAINSTGLDAHVGFLHEMQPGKYSLAYDLQEPFRFLVDLAVITLIENEAMAKGDFVRTENYNLRLRPTGARKVTEKVNRWFNKAVEYQGKESAWSYIIFLKTRELAHYLTGKKRKLDFSTPLYEIDRQDSDEIRRKILAIPYAEWKKMGFSKGTLFYLKKNARDGKPFTMNKHVWERLEQWEDMTIN